MRNCEKSRDGKFSARDAARSGRGEASLSDLVKRWMKQSRVGDRLDPDSLFQRWREAVGEEIASQTRIVSADKGELVVEVGSAPLLNELATYRSQEILEALAAREEFRGIRKLRFRAGSL